jgi:hypothetical protein
LSAIDTLSNLESYSVEPKDGSVIAWVTEHKAPNRKEDKRDIQFTIKAESLKLKDATKDEL